MKKYESFFTNVEKLFSFPMQKTPSCSLAFFVSYKQNRTARQPFTGAIDNGTENPSQSLIFKCKWHMSRLTN